MADIKGVFKKKNVMVIGGAGFIGSHICEILIKSRQAQVICVDNLVSGSLFNIEGVLQSPDFKFIRHDITQPFAMSAFPELAIFNIGVQGIQEIYNCATPTSYKDPNRLSLETAAAHSVGVKHSLELAREHSARYLYLSSSAVYGDPLPEQETFSEEYWGYINPTGDRATYNEGKRFAEALCTAYQRAYDLPIHIARIFSTYGARMIMDEGRHIPDFITAALQNKDIVIYGDESKAQSFCYISDTIDALLKLMQSSIYEPINIGNPDVIALKEIAEYVIQKTESTSKITYDKPLLHMHDQGIPNIARARGELGWFPVIRLHDGLNATIQYMQSAQSRYQQNGLWEASTLDREE